MSYGKRVGGEAGDMPLTDWEGVNQAGAAATQKQGTDFSTNCNYQYSGGGIALVAEFKWAASALPRSSEFLVATRRNRQSFFL
jgi:hypothetical protein